jgi:hypothetical protein
MPQYRNIVVRVPRGNAGWQWGHNQWQEWCAVNCRGDYQVVAYNNSEITGGFDLESDAMMFMLRWS